VHRSDQWSKPVRERLIRCTTVGDRHLPQREPDKVDADGKAF
jgi:hypothetical protein